VMLALPRGRNILQGAWQLRAMLKAEKDPKSHAWKVG
jgi:hypothetical protein